METDREGQSSPPTPNSPQTKNPDACAQKIQKYNFPTLTIPTPNFLVFGELTLIKRYTNITVT